MKGFLGLSMLAAASADSTVSKVIQLLDELKGKVQADLATETEAMESYNKWCETQVTETSYAIKDSKRVINEESAKIEGAQGTIDKSDAAIGELGPAIAGKQQEAAEAMKKREEEHSVFKATEAELVEADDMLRRAYGILKRATTKGGAFLQASDKMNEVIAALGAIVDAAWMQPEKAQKIKSFMDDDLSFAQAAPQASTSNYDSKSGGILQTIDEMRDQVQADLQAARTAETKGKHANELFQQGAANEVKIFGDQLAQAQANKAAATTKLGNAQKSLKAEQETLAADEAYLQETQHSCADKSASWTQRQADAAEEMTTLDAAKEVLSSKVVVLAQVSMSTRRFSDEAIEKRNKVVAMLRRMGHKFNSFGLLQAASSAQADPFAKVRELVSNMIAKLEKQAADESSFKETCDKNLKEMRAKKQKKEQAQEKYQTRLTGAQAKSTQNKNLIAKLKGELKALAQATKEAIAARNKEHADNTKVVADNKASASAVAEAINILREFYGNDKEAFLQKGEAAPGVEFAAAKSDGTHGIIAILETAQADFTKLYEETEAAEGQAAADHSRFIQAGDVTKAKKSALIQGKEAENKSLAVQVSEINTDLDTTTRELDDVSKALAAEEDRCANKAMSYEERKQRREAELAGLKDALEVLKPDSEE